MTDSPLTDAELADAYRRRELQHLQRQAEALDRMADSATTHTRHLERQAAALETLRTYVALWFWLSLVGAVIVIFVSFFDLGPGY